MDFLSNLNVVEIIQNVAIVNAGLMVIGSMLPEKWFYKIGHTGGTLGSKLLRLRLGKGGGEKVEGFIQKRLNALVKGINDGADADDQA